jgi:hypothetical protein
LALNCRIDALGGGEVGLGRCALAQPAPSDASQEHHVGIARIERECGVGIVDGVLCLVQLEVREGPNAQRGFVPGPKAQRLVAVGECIGEVIREDGPREAPPGEAVSISRVEPNDLVIAPQSILEPPERFVGQAPIVVRRHILGIEIDCGLELGNRRIIALRVEIRETSSVVRYRFRVRPHVGGAYRRGPHETCRQNGGDDDAQRPSLHATSGSATIRHRPAATPAPRVRPRAQA